MTTQNYPPASGPFASLSEEDKKKRLDAMVGLWQRDTGRLLQREGQDVFLKSQGLDEYRYSVWLRFPEWERSAVVGQVVSLPAPQRPEQSPDATGPLLFSAWRRDPLLKSLPDWKEQLAKETVFNIIVRLTPGSLGEGTKWAVMMPKEMIPRYRPGWPTQKEWVTWTRSFDWLSVAVGFIRSMLDTLE
jgi:hypothetical protein